MNKNQVCSFDLESFRTPATLPLTREPVVVRTRKPCHFLTDEGSQKILGSRYWHKSDAAKAKFSPIRCFVFSTSPLCPLRIVLTCRSGTGKFIHLDVFFHCNLAFSTVFLFPGGTLENSA